MQDQQRPHRSEEEWAELNAKANLMTALWNQSETLRQQLQIDADNRTSQIEQLLAEIKRGDAQIEQLPAEIKRRDTQIEQLLAEIKRRDAQIASTRTSVSWHLAAPARALERWIRGADRKAR
jgi:peptidoglycan hydrolase CwlO-like protein